MCFHLRPLYICCTQLCCTTDVEYLSCLSFLPCFTSKEASCVFIHALFTGPSLHLINSYRKGLPLVSVFFVGGGGEAQKLNDNKMITTLPAPKFPDSSVQCPRGIFTFQNSHSSTKKLSLFLTHVHLTRMQQGIVIPRNLQHQVFKLSYIQQCTRNILTSTWTMTAT